ncbi:hypothetical protein [uncultured Tateyamaria sp.]|uniref:hypothetical protein n=1 Tax=uncultured Tateyamaria sp. TaxID=455651 RepID=UPI00261228B7|nr:hypothetical protein [uncultured Tateyamaria sp.]
MSLSRDGFVVFDSDPRVAAWARAAHRAASRVANDPVVRAQNLRHGQTWFVGVDVLSNDPDGAVDGVPLAGPWQDQVPDVPMHKGQVSIIYPGYPQRDPDQSAANHRYRITRAAAHVDGLLPEGPERHRYAREFHAYVLGLPLNAVGAAPTVVWPGSQKIMQSAIAEAIGKNPVEDVDLTEAYHAARRTVFDSCDPVPVHATPGQSFLIHRFALHGTAPWQGAVGPGRMIAFFRPEFPDPLDWLQG